MTEAFDVEAARNETVSSLSGCLARMSKAAHLLTIAQRIQLAETARDLADALDQGVAVNPGPIRRHFLRTQHVDEDGAPLFREVVNQSR
jgi:hypothetical protein